MDGVRLEICVDSVGSALIAQEAGADRVELCASLSEGGTTPAYGTIVSARNNLTIGLHVIIRPRGGDFLYSGLELDIMKKDIELCGELGVDGVVLGLLQLNGSVDVERTAKLIEFAKPMTVTFHRAFDMCSDPLAGLEDIISTGAARILTSGQMNKASEGINLIRKLVLQAGDRIIIMAGSGINESNVSNIVSSTGVREVHLTGRKSVMSEMIFRREGIIMGSTDSSGEFLHRVTDIEKIKAIAGILSHK